MKNMGSRSICILQLLFCVMLCLGFVAESRAQKLDMKKLQGMSPRSIGPAGMSGRVTDFAVVESDPNIMYAGTASGGLWKSTDAGLKWIPIFDDQPAASIGAVAVYQKNPDIIWVGTGEGNPRNSQSSGAGVFKSIDGGKTWKFMGLEKTRNIHRVIINPDNPDIVYLGVQGTAWGETEERGVYKTTDGGKTWKKILYNNKHTGIGDLVMDPSNPNKLIAAMWEFHRWPWFFKSGGEGSGLYVTYDGGEHWQKRTHKDGLPEGELGRIGLAIARSNPQVVYAYVESHANALYRSDDGGRTWQRRATVKKDPQVGDRPFYYADIYVDPTNENRVYSLYSRVSMSIDGGKTFNTIMGYSEGVHPDHHAWWIDPNDPDFILDGNDGGMYITRDRAKTWRHVSDLPVGQFYHINYDMQIPYNVYGGLQDNGSWQGPAQVWRRGGILNSYWENIGGGDGFDAVVDSSNNRYVYAMSQQGFVSRVDLETGHSRFIRPTNPDGPKLRFNWNAAIAHDPLNPTTIYFGSQFLHKSTDRGDSWKIISPDLTTNNPAKQKQSESGGLTIDATGAENFTTIIAISPSPIKSGILWVGTDDGNIQLSRDGGQNWTNLAKNVKGVPEGSWVAQVHASKYNEAEAVAVINNYRRNDWTPYVMRTTNYGKSWTNIVEGKGLEGYALSFVQDPVEPKLMFVGTELGLYVSIDAGKNWTKWTNDYPTVSTYDMKIHPRDYDLLIGTFGRSVYILDDIRPLRAMARAGSQELDKTMKVFTPPVAYLAQYKSETGEGETPDQSFVGQNRPTSARLTYSIQKADTSGKNKEKAKGKNSGKKEKVKIEVFDASGKKIRSYDDTPKYDGLNRTTWNLRMDGAERPRRQRRSGGGGGFFGRNPSGPEVLPGTYKIKMTYRGQSDSTQVKVKFDPRISVTMAGLRARQQMLEDLQGLQKQMAQATNKLLDAQDMAKAVSSMLKSNKDESKKEEVKTFGKQTKEIQDGIDSLMTEVFGKERPDTLQGIMRDRGPNLMEHINQPAYYIQSSLQGPGPTERMLMNKARESVQKGIKDINAFLTGPWSDYVDAVQRLNIKPVKKIDPVDME